MVEYVTFPHVSEVSSQKKNSQKKDSFPKIRV